jgi:glucose-1-phosphate adenylyltransferase
VTIVPAQMRMGESWYRGTADSIRQNFHLVEDFRPDVVVVFGSDHVYKMNVRQMVEFHAAKSALATIACIPVPVAEASDFGIVQVDSEGRVIGFQEKPKENVITIPGDPTRALASMGNYIFDPLTLNEQLEEDANTNSHHDFGRNILPNLLKSGRVFCYDFSENRIPGLTEKGELAYWRETGVRR